MISLLRENTRLTCFKRHSYSSLTLKLAFDLMTEMILGLPRNCFCINLSSLELIKILFSFEGQLWFETADWWTAKDAREIQRTIKSMCNDEQEAAYRKGE